MIYCKQLPHCGERAAYRYTWPGKNESHVCELHSLKLLAVANAIGLPLQLIALTDIDHAREDDT
jgi:hypothetical protein